MLTPLAAFVFAFLACLAIVPFAKRFAFRNGIVDSPDKKRKLHGRTIPLAGGIAVFTTLLITITFAIVFDLGMAERIVANAGQAIGLLLASVIILAIGVVDDKYGMRGRQKLAGQCIAVGVLIFCGFRFSTMSFMGYEMPMHFLSIGLVAIWLLGTINALNLIDGADGLASTIGAIVSGSIVFMALENHPSEAAMAAALTGALVGFLVYNFPPASVFLGDAGSMLIGLLVGALAIRCSVKEAATFTLIAPIAILTVPIFDSVAAIVRRRLTGRSIYQVDRGHLHHTLLERGIGPRRMLLWVAGLCLITGIGGVLSVILQQDWIAALSVVMVITFLVAGRIFGFAEFRLLSGRANKIARSFLMSPREQQKQVRETTVRLQGSRNWGQLWESITEFAETHELSDVKLDLSLPWLHEGFHATWDRSVRVEAHEEWHSRLPLAVNGTVYGRLEVSGPLTRSSIFLLLSLLADLLESLEPVILKLAHEGAESVERVETETQVSIADEVSEKLRKTEGVVSEFQTVAPAQKRG